MMMRATEPSMQARRSKAVEKACDIAFSPVRDWRCTSHPIPKASHMSPPKSILKVSIRQIKAARALLDWSQKQLAEAANVSVPTIKRLEAEEGPLGGRSGTGEKIEAALKKGGVEFIDENGGGAGVRLKKPLKKRT